MDDTNMGMSQNWDSSARAAIVNTGQNTSMLIFDHCKHLQSTPTNRTLFSSKFWSPKTRGTWDPAEPPRSIARCCWKTWLESHQPGRSWTAESGVFLAMAALLTSDLFGLLMESTENWWFHPPANNFSTSMRIP